MLIQKLARFLFALAIVALLATGCGGETTIIDDSAAADTVDEAEAETATETEADTADDTSDTTEPTAVPESSEAEPTVAPEPTTAPEPTPTSAETDESSDQGQDATDTDNDGDDTTLANRDEAVALIVSEGFIQRDAECIADGAFEVFGTWDFIESDPTAAQGAELDQLLDECITDIPGPDTGTAPPGTDPELDALWIACTDGSASACDDLFFDSPIGSDYEAYGYSCGGRAIDSCSDVLGDDSAERNNSSDTDTSTDTADGDVPGPATGSAPPGTDADLDALWIACTDGSASACDDLFWQSPVGSDYEAYGLSCGGREITFCSSILDD